MTTDRSEEIGVLIDLIHRYYLYPDVGQQVGEVLREEQARGSYDGLTDDQRFADVVTDDMQSVNADPHLFLQYSPAEIVDGDDVVVDGGALRAERSLLDGHGFTRVERLPGNVGLLQISLFYDPSVGGAGAAAIAAMNLVAGADALIIDLRENTGGEPDMLTLVAGYLFDDRCHLVDVHFPAEQRVRQYWTGFAPGPAFGGTKPVDVLISRRTFSGAESFSYLVQQSGRGTLIGEATADRPVTFHYLYRVSAHLYCAVPSGYPIDPNSGRNWEGGVQPDIAVSADLAFPTAYRRALQHVLGLGEDGARSRVAAAARTALAELGGI